MFFNLLGQRKDISIHFVGVGGIGMSGIAEVLLSLGVYVSGSDANSSDNTEKLKKLGATIYIGHKETNITNPSMVVFSSAIKDYNPEIQAAKNKKIPIVKRAEMLGDIMRLKYGLAVAGTHGKTTTTSALATILEASGLDPTYIIGGIPKNLSGHAKVGKGEYVVAEADESDGSFLLLNPIMSVITNIDNDHMDHYGTEEKLIQAFLDFANKIPFYGRCALNRHDEKLMSLRPNIKRPTVIFGIEDKQVKSTDLVDYEARNVNFESNKTTYDLFYQGEYKVKITMNLPGTHNVLNGLGAISVAHGLGLDFSQIAQSLLTFEGVGRRFQVLFSNQNLEVIDDYGHHPTEILKTLETAKKTRPDRKIIIVFEPHRFTRTRDCWTQFLHCFNNADVLYLCPIYSASETPIEGILTTRLVSDINKLHPNFAIELERTENLKDILAKKWTSPTTVLTLGAGSIGKKVREYIKELFP